jgi:hypothetical protein
VDGSHIWIANSGASRAGGSVTELNASNGGWIQTLSDGTWIQSLLRGCIPGVLASGGYHFSNPGLVAAVGTHIWVFGRDRVRVLTDPAARPGRGSGSNDAGQAVARRRLRLEPRAAAGRWVRPRRVSDDRRHARV